ncbi:MAG: hypothetical protein KJN60_05780, partial [Boseongicola sp.]|nr:hypothetical protein [Boseongicola sp.]
MTEMDPPKDVQAAIERLPAAPRARMLELRALILAAAAEAKVTPLTETLKWGQPSFAPVPRSDGTPIRIGWSEKTPETIG